MMKAMLDTPVKGTNFEKTSKSILYLGQAVTGEEMWMSPDQVKTHIFLSGSTGSGKTEMINNLLANTMAWGSGALVIDGKGDIGFFAKMQLIARETGREEDLLLLNFMKSNVAEGEAFSSHTFNPFGFLSSSELCQIMATMMPPAYGDGVMWRERAVVLMNTIINVLTWLRDNKGETLTVSKIRTVLGLPDFITLCERMKEMEDAPESIVSEMKFYLTSLPGYQESKFRKQSQTTFDQHGYLSMQWNRVVSLLVTQYGHILDAPIPDIDIRDVILNRRILVMLLPSLDRSSSDIQNIGSLMTGMIKSMLGQALRTPVEGSWATVVDDRITNAKTPFMIIMDEVGQYLSDGMGMLAQQARSLNIGLVFATQDFDSLYLMHPKETEAIIANTNTKILMKAENPHSAKISAILAPFIQQKTTKISLINMLDMAKGAVLRDRLFHAQLQQDRELSMDAVQKMDAQNLAHLEHVEASQIPDFGFLLRSFSNGQMLVMNGKDCIQGTANFIAVEESPEAAPLAINHFFDLRGYGKVEDETVPRKKLAEDITAQFREKMDELRASGSVSKEYALFTNDLLDGTVFTQETYRNKKDPTFLTGNLESQDYRRVWPQYIASLLLKAVKIEKGTAFSNLNEMVAKKRNESARIEKGPKVEPYDYTQIIKDFA
jgi:hypothetical protein